MGDKLNLHTNFHHSSAAIKQLIFTNHVHIYHYHHSSPYYLDVFTELIKFENKYKDILTVTDNAVRICSHPSVTWGYCSQIQ